MQGEKECSYYLKTGQCKFGPTCKFHHPQHLGTSVLSSAPAFYTPVPPPPVPSPHHHQYTPMANWQVARPPVLPGSYMPGPYAPMLLSPGVVPVQNWSPYLVCVWFVISKCFDRIKLVWSIFIHFFCY